MGLSSAAGMTPPRLSQRKTGPAGRRGWDDGGWLGGMRQRREGGGWHDDGHGKEREDGVGEGRVIG